MGCWDSGGKAPNREGDSSLAAYGTLTLIRLSLCCAPDPGYAIYSWGRKKNEFYNSKEGHRLHGDEE